MSRGVGVGGQNAALRLQCGYGPLKVAVEVASQHLLVSITYLLTLLTDTPYPYRALITPFVEPIALSGL